MTPNTQRFLFAFSSLTAAEQKEIKTEIDRHQKETGEKQASINKEFRSTGRVIMGPTGSACPTCGK